MTNDEGTTAGGGHDVNAGAMPAQEIAVGDVVVLRSGGPLMVVERIDSRGSYATASAEAHVSWFASDGLRTASIATAALMRADTLQRYADEILAWLENTAVLPEKKRGLALALEILVDTTQWAPSDRTLRLIQSFLQ